jgi:AraC family transcriptional regulator, regulatory protein of adaptative response / methylated-DNA-[protein]-cysteine methyltransferase
VGPRQSLKIFLHDPQGSERIPIEMLLRMAQVILRRHDMKNVQTQFRVATTETPLGVVLVVAGDRGIRAIELGDDRETMLGDFARRHLRTQLVEDAHGLQQILAEVVALIAAPAMDHALDLDPDGTDFQLRVWRALRTIAVGSTASYSDVAQRIGRPTATRAVARACAQNTLAVAIPCHRVVRADGSLSGYRWGTARKRALLARERAA